MTETDLPSTSVFELPTARGRRRWLLPGLMLVVFASGTIVGAGTALLVVRNRALMRIHYPREAAAKDTARLQKALGLTDTQAEKVEEILLARHAAVYENVQTEFARLEREVDGVLTGDQKPRWHAMLKWFHNRWIPRKEPRTSDSDP